MRLRNEKSETGHLLSFISKREKQDNFSLFFPVEGLGEFDTLLEITKGFEKCLEEWPGLYDYIGFSISNHGEIEKVFPEIDDTRIFYFEQTEFLSEKSCFLESFGKAILKRFVQNQKQIFPNIVTGAMAVGSGFYDREDAVREIWEHLENKKNILLRAPRRFGKTSLLNHISKNPALGWNTCFVDLEGGDSPENFIEKILAAMLIKQNFDPYLLSHLTGQHIYSKTEGERLKIFREERKAIQNNWKEYAKALFDQVENLSENLRFLFILDEVSFLVEDMMEKNDTAKDKIIELMEWLSNIRSKYNKLKFIISGSEHLPSFLEAFGIDGQLYDLEKVHLDLFDGNTTEDFIFLVLAGEKIVADKKEIDLIQTLMGKPIPYFLHLFLDTICRTCKEQKSVSSDEVSSIFYDKMLGSESKRYFESITKQIERYKRYGSRNSAGAKSILDRLALAENSVPEEELKTIWYNTTGSLDKFNIMIDIMQDDFYLATDKSQNIFIDSRLIKEWWQMHGNTGLR